MLRLVIATAMVASFAVTASASPTDDRYPPSRPGSYQTIPHTTSHYRYRHHYRVARHVHVRAVRSGHRQRAGRRVPVLRQPVASPNAWVAFSVPDDRYLVSPQPGTFPEAARHPRRAVRFATTVANGPQTAVYGGRPAGAPRAWCGFWLARHLGIGDRSLWLARNWAGVGRSAGGPRVGAIVVWRHHVGMITGQAGGKWVVKSGNDGRAVRERPRSIAGAIAFRVL
jgi:hypothetical protein